MEGGHARVALAQASGSVQVSGPWRIAVQIKLPMKTQTYEETGPFLIHAPARVAGAKATSIPFRKVVTTSWDDGDPFDLRVAEMLAARKLSGTFYIPAKRHQRACRMNLCQMLALSSQRFEIGAHSVTHANLSHCNDLQLMVEVESCKKRLEDDLGKEVSMFAYPGGRHNHRVIASLKQAGYSGARTTAMMGRHLSFDPFRMPTSLHVFPHTRFEYFRNLARAWDLRRAWVYATHLRCARDWVELAKLLFDSVLRDGGIWHLYGHSWEIEEMGLWNKLQDVLDYVAQRPDVDYVTNGGALPLRAVEFPSHVNQAAAQ